MPPQRRLSKAQKEGRILLALNAYQAGHKPSLHDAPLSYRAAPRTLNDRTHGRIARVFTRANFHKLTTTEEEVLIQCILSVDERRYSPKPSAVRDAASIIL
jgi:hypothetical protein